MPEIFTIKASDLVFNNFFEVLRRGELSGFKSKLDAESEKE